MIPDQARRSTACGPAMETDHRSLEKGIAMKTSSGIHANERLRHERIARNWRQQDLAEQVGTTVGNIKRWEWGSHHR
jgi:ribosome-binding protein aMBF1 (putative translation factor)